MDRGTNDAEAPANADPGGRGAAATDPNAHVRSYLRHYLGFAHSPRFAVLVAGPWGIGKTHLLRAFLSEEMADRKVAYVSLFGLKGAGELDEALFAALYPRATGKAARIATGVAKAVLRHVKYEVDLTQSDLLDRFAADLYVFDDLERSGMGLNEALGYINRFVEHDGCKVVIVANVDEIAPGERAEFERRREKLVGRTLEVRSAFVEAYAWFRSKVDDAATTALFAEEAREVASLYEQSGLQNLRVLQQTMWDFERVHAALDDRQRANRPAMLHLMRLLCALSFETKSGRIAAANLRDRVKGVMLGLLDDRKTPTPMRVANDRYPNVQLYDAMLDDDLLQDILVRGVVDGAAIRAALDRSPEFAGGEEPAWRTVWHSYDRPEEEVLAAFDVMERQFAAHEFTLGGEIMHVVGLQLHLSDVGVLGLTRAQVAERAIRYIDEVRSLGTLEPAPDPGRDDLRYGGYGGLGLTQSDTPEFTSVFQHLVQARIGAAQDRHPAMAAALMEDLAADPERFARQIVDEADGGRAAAEPVLAAIDPEAFAQALVALPAPGQRAVLSALSLRYDAGRLSGRLAPEAAWAQSVRRLVLEAAEAASPLTRHRLQESVRFSLDKHLPDAAPAPTAEEAGGQEQDSEPDVAASLGPRTNGGEADDDVESALDPTTLAT